MSARLLALGTALILAAGPVLAQGPTQEPPPEPLPVLTPPPPLAGRGIYVVREFRNAALAGVLSMVAPGGGQVYNDEMAKFLVTAGGLAGTGAAWYFNQEQIVRILAAGGFSLLWLWSVGDAYLSAAEYNHQLEEAAY